MDLTGKIHAVLPIQEGEGKNGTWKNYSQPINITKSDGEYGEVYLFARVEDKAGNVSGSTTYQRIKKQNFY